MTPAVFRYPSPVLIHPGSGGPHKCWPRDRFESLIHSLRQRGAVVRPLLGEVELDTWPHAVVQHWLDDLHAQRVASLDDLADALLAAGAYVGNDSGPTHLAAQLDIPTLALFGPTDPAIWSPRGGNVRVLAPPSPRPMDWLEPGVVLDALAL